MTEARGLEQTADSLGRGPDPAGPDNGSDAGTDSDADSRTDDADADTGSSRSPGRGRPFLERVGMAMIALVLALLFGAIALAAFAGGEPFLGAMAGIGCLMTLWVGGLTLVRG